jgi:hypothetical protein
MEELNLLEERTPTKPIAGMRQVDAPVGGLSIAVATGVPQKSVLAVMPCEKVH